MSRFFSVSTTIASNCLFTLALSVFMWGQFEDTEIEFGVPPARLHVDIDAIGVSFTRLSYARSLCSIISQASDPNHWENKFTLRSTHDWQNAAFAYEDNIVITTIDDSGKRLTMTASERYGVRHWCLCLASGALFGLVHRRYLLMLWPMFGRYRRRSQDERDHRASSRAA